MSSTISNGSEGRDHPHDDTHTRVMVDVQEGHVCELFAHNEEQSVCEFYQLGDVVQPQGLGVLKQRH